MLTSLQRHVLPSLIFFFPLMSLGQTYVSNAALSDGGNGTLANPYKTIKYAVSVAPVGNMVYILAGVGTYKETGDIVISKSLTLKKYGIGEVIIDAVDRPIATDNKTIIKVSDASNVTIDSLTLRNCIGYGSKAIGVNGSGNNVVIKNCTIYNIGWKSNDLTTAPPSTPVAQVANAIHIAGTVLAPLTNDSILNNHIYNCATGFGEAVTVTGNVNGFLVSNNKVHDISNIGIDIAGNYTYTNPNPSVNQARNGTITANEVYNCMSSKAISAGIYLDGAVNCIVERNRVYQNGAGISVGSEQPTGAGATLVYNHKIYNNAIYRNVLCGMSLGCGDVSRTLSNVSVNNNIVYGNRTGAVINGITNVGTETLASASSDFGGDILLRSSSFLSLSNNIIVPRRNKRAIVATTGYTIANYTSKYNLFYRADGYPLMDIANDVASFNGSTALGGSYYSVSALNVIGLEPNSLLDNPRFVDSTVNNFALLSGSPAINMGNPSSNAASCGTLDLVGNPRFVNTLVDAGAIEYQNSSLGLGLLQFLSAYLYNAQVKIDWATQTEVNSKHFEVLRSSDGISFQALGVVIAAGNSSVSKQYSFLDKAPFIGINYYRLKMVDRSNQYNLSSIVSVDFDRKLSSSIYPNPVISSFSIISMEKIKLINVLDTEGKLMMQLPPSSDNKYFVGQLPKGNYLLILFHENDKQEVVKFQKM